MIEYLKFKIHLFGLDAPAFAFVVAGCLIAFTVYSLVRLFFLIRRQVDDLNALSAQIDDKEYKPGPGEGLPAEQFDKIDKILLKHRSEAFQSAWREFRAHAVKRDIVAAATTDAASPAAGTKAVFWSTKSADESFSERKLTTGRFSREYYQSLPGIITGIGLLTTFLAILVALLDVRLVDNRVQGLELLIQGLSGKFITSVVALSCATLFIFREKSQFHALAKAQLRFANLLDHTVPQLSSVHAILDLQQSVVKGFETVGVRSEKQSAILNQQTAVITDGFRLMNQKTESVRENVEQQTVCIQDFNTGLAPMLQQTFDESMTPTLERMITSIEGLNGFLRSAEAAKSDSIVDSVKDLLSGLQSSLTGTLTEMGGRFNDSLSGGAQQQFAAIADTLRNTTSMLDSMNQQFAVSQTALHDLISNARTTTQDQISLNNQQLGGLAETIGALMTGLSGRVDELSEQMSRSVQENSQQAVGAADRVISKAEEWSNGNAAQLTRLLSAHETQFDKVAETRELLDGTIVRFSESLANLTRISAISQSAVEQIRGAADSLKTAAETTAQAQMSLKNVADLTARQIEKLGESHEQQQELWQRVAGSMDQYQRTFTTVEGSAGKLLDQIGTNLSNYQAMCEKGFNNLVKTSDEHFTNASQRLGSSVSELDDVLGDLADTLAKASGDIRNGR